MRTQIEINLLDFFRDAKFDCIKTGQTKEWILNNFTEPDAFNLHSKLFMSTECNIWTYGSIEFHFNQEGELFLIYSEYLDEFDIGEDLKLEKWILNDYSALTLSYTLIELNKQNINYCKSDDSFEGVKLKLESGVELSFTNGSDEKIEDPNELHLNNFSLMDSVINSVNKKGNG